MISLPRSHLAANTAYLGEEGSVPKVEHVPPGGTAFFGHIRNDAKGLGAHTWLLGGGGKVKRVLKNGSIVKPYAGNMYCTRERYFFQSQRARKAYYLHSETATYIGRGKEDKGHNMEEKRKQVRAELRFQSTDWAVT